VLVHVSPVLMSSSKAALETDSSPVKTTDSAVRALALVPLDSAAQAQDVSSYPYQALSTSLTIPRLRN
jgi:hypothetical protein